MKDGFGRSSWFDLTVTNLADAMSFYRGLLGWDYRQMDPSPETDYVMIDVEGTLIGGLRKVPAMAPLQRSLSHSPILYFTVAHLASHVARAKELGAELVGSIVELSQERGRYQWIRDREGNLIGLWSKE